MTTLEFKMIDILRDLRDKNGVTAVKAEFEAEASRLHELMRLKDISGRAGLDMVLKIGGAEAVTDMFEAKNIGTSLLVAPMVESPYALRKYLEAIEKHFSKDFRKKMLFGVNIETELAYKNFPEMLKEKKIKLLSTITVGRTDMCGSLGIDRYQVNSDVIYKITEDIFSLAKKKGFNTTVGGGIGPEAAKFIKKLVSKGLLDRFETRKVVFNLPAGMKRIREGIVKANKFEILWLENKKEFYGKIFHEDNARIQHLLKMIKGEI